METVGYTQVSWLRVEDPLEDSVYTCVVTSQQFPKSEKFRLDVRLDVFSEFYFLVVFTSGYEDRTILLSVKFCLTL